MSSPSIPDALEKFPESVKQAYTCFKTTGDIGAVQEVVLAAILDFMPRVTGREPPTLSDDQRLIEDLGYDSLAVAETVFFLEDLLQLKIGNHELMEIRTVGELKNYAAQKAIETAVQS